MICKQADLLSKYSLIIIECPIYLSNRFLAHFDIFWKFEFLYYEDSQYIRLEILWCLYKTRLYTKMLRIHLFGVFTIKTPVTNVHKKLYISEPLNTSFSYTFCNFDNHVSHWESSSLKYKTSRLTCLELRFWYFSKASLGSDPSSLIFFIHSSFCYKKNPTPFQNLNIIILTCENVKIPRFLLLTINPCLYIIIFLKFFLVVSSYIQCRVPASGFKKKNPKKVQFKLLDLFSL